MFIELTDYETGRKVLINTQWIEEIRDTEDYIIIYFAVYLDDQYEQDCIKVKEEYQEIKHLLGVDEIPKADTERHSHWIFMGDCGVTKCSNCDWTICECLNGYEYCPNCGCRMDEEKEFNNEC